MRTSTMFFLYISQQNFVSKSHYFFRRATITLEPRLESGLIKFADVFR